MGIVLWKVDAGCPQVWVAGLQTHPTGYRGLTLPDNLKVILNEKHVETC